MSTFRKDNRGPERGFTFIELILVIVMIGILASVAAERMISASEKAEITAEGMTIDTMRANLVNNFAQDLIDGEAAVFPEDPFANLSKVPEGYDRRRIRPPTGDPDDDGVWMFARGSTTGQLTPEEAGTTLETFNTTGFVYHQRRDHTVVKWPYDSNNGVIGKKIIEEVSELKRERDRQRLLRGEQVEQQEPRTR